MGMFVGLFVVGMFVTSCMLISYLAASWMLPIKCLIECQGP